jgi:hypothetical protein
MNVEDMSTTIPHFYILVLILLLNIYYAKTTLGTGHGKGCLLEKGVGVGGEM